MPRKKTEMCFVYMSMLSMITDLRLDSLLQVLAGQELRAVVPSERGLVFLLHEKSSTIRRADDVATLLVIDFECIVLGIC